MGETKKTYRRIAIAALRRRITLTAGLSESEHEVNVVRIYEPDSMTVVETDSAEGEAILAEALRLIEDTLATRRHDQ